MKKCEYCAKEISYNEMYCSQKCEELSVAFYNKSAKLQKLISAVNILGTTLIAVGIFLYAMINCVGAFMIGTGGLSLGIVNLCIPIPTDNLIKKHKLSKACTLVRIIGIILLVFGIAGIVLGIIRL